MSLIYQVHSLKNLLTIQHLFARKQLNHLRTNQMIIQLKKMQVQRSFHWQREYRECMEKEHFELVLVACPQFSSTSEWPNHDLFPLMDFISLSCVWLISDILLRLRILTCRNFCIILLLRESDSFTRFI